MIIVLGIIKLKNKINLCIKLSIKEKLRNMK